jgi:hypothetical protein
MMSNNNVCYAIHYKGELATEILPSAKIFYTKESTAKSAMKCSIAHVNKLKKYYAGFNFKPDMLYNLNDFSIVKYVPEGE